MTEYNGVTYFLAAPQGFLPIESKKDLAMLDSTYPQMYPVRLRDFRRSRKHVTGFPRTYRTIQPVLSYCAVPAIATKWELRLTPLRIRWSICPTDDFPPPLRVPPFTGVLGQVL